MRKLPYILILILLAAIIVPVLWSTSQGAGTSSTSSLNKGLIGYWPLDLTSNRSSTITADKTPYAHNGTSSGSPTLGGATDRHGQASHATAFVGASNQYITTGNVGNVKSVSFWVNASTTTERFLELINNSAYISVSSGTVSATGFTSPTIYIDNIATTTGFTASAWHHIVVTTGTNVAAASMVIGEANNVYLTGSLSDVRVYDRAITATEVAQLYNSYRPKISTGSLQKGLVGYWPLDSASKRSSTILADKTPNRMHGTGNGWMVSKGGGTDMHGQANKASEFDGYYGAVNIGDLTYLNSVSKFSISYWATIDTYSDNNIIFYKGPTVATRLEAFVDNTSVYWVRMGTNNNASFNYANVVPVSTWANVVIIYDGTQADNANRLKIYVNNSQVTLGFGGIIPATTYDMIGDSASISSQSTNAMDGKMCEFRIYNRALSSTEVTSLYNYYRPKISTGSLQKGLVGYWPLDQTSLKSSTTIKDSTPFGHNGTSSGSPTLGGATDRKGQTNRATAFVGASSQYITTGNVSNVKSVSFWVNANSTTENFLELINNSTYISVSSGTVSATGFTAPTIYIDNIATTTGFTASAWHHIVVTTGTNVAAASMVIGEANNAYLTGNLANVRIYNRALSAAEVTALYNSY